MIFKCEWCDLQYEEKNQKCMAIINRLGTPEFCGGPVKEILPCPYCDLNEYQCRCEMERYEDR